MEDRTFPQGKNASVPLKTWNKVKILPARHTRLFTVLALESKTKFSPGTRRSFDRAFIHLKVGV